MDRRDVHVSRREEMSEYKKEMPVPILRIGSGAVDTEAEGATNVMKREIGRSRHGGREVIVECDRISL